VGRRASEGLNVAITETTNSAALEDPAERWFPWREPNPRANVRLLCLPFSGGVALNYRAWSRMLPQADVCAVELPGHGTRRREPLIADMSILVQQLLDVVRRLPDRPLVVFGHSLGAFVGFDLVQAMVESGMPEPRCLVVSAALAPDDRKQESVYGERTDDETIERLRRLDGTPKEVLENEELMALSLPVIRADYRLIKTRRQPPYRLLSCPLVGFCGADDPLVSPSDMIGWQQRSSRSCSTRVFPGRHFYVHQDSAAPLEEIARLLRPV